MKRGCYLDCAGPHAALRRVVAVDPAAALSVLQEGLVGWDALDSDLLEAAASCVVAPPAGAPARFATQVLWLSRAASSSATCTRERHVQYRGTMLPRHGLAWATGLIAWKG